MKTTSLIHHQPHSAQLGHRVHNWEKILKDVLREARALQRKHRKNSPTECAAGEWRESEFYRTVLSPLHADGGSWKTCACGQLSKMLPRYHDGQPGDELLADLGRHFSNLFNYLFEDSLERVIIFAEQLVPLVQTIHARADFLLQSEIAVRFSKLKDLEKQVSLLRQELGGISSSEV